MKISTSRPFISKHVNTLELNVVEVIHTELRYEIDNIAFP